MIRSLTITSAMLIAISANAQALNDPMRPPALMSAGTMSKGGPILQTVYIGQDRRYAIIDGERVAQGGFVGDAKVMRIAPNEVTLRDSSGETVLKLYPQVDKLILTMQPSARSSVPAERGKK